MFEIEQAYYFYIELILSPFGFIIPIAMLIAAPVGIWALKKTERNAWGAAIAFVLFLASFVYVCYVNISLRGVLVANILANVFLGAVLGFLAAIIVIKIREKAA